MLFWGGIRFSDQRNRLKMQNCDKHNVDSWTEEEKGFLSWFGNTVERFALTGPATGTTNHYAGKTVDSSGYAEELRQRLLKIGISEDDPSSPLTCSNLWSLFRCGDPAAFWFLSMATVIQSHRIFLSENLRTQLSRPIALRGPVTNRTLVGTSTALYTILQPYPCSSSELTSTKITMDLCQGRSNWRC